ncbi:MAG: ABC transporter permease subunit [Treponema sp.]|jgi:thiamine transport system permease protein|nr:ABC transporter permease subunit [Treponema sp.]
MRTRQQTGVTGKAAAWIMALPPLALAALAFAIPYAASLGLGLAGTGRDYLVLVKRVLPILAFTLKQATLSTLLALALGLPGAWFLSSPAGGRRGGPSPLRRFLRSLSALPFALPPILVVLGFALFFGNSGWVNRALGALNGTTAGPLRILYRPEAIILAHGFYNFPLVLRLAGDSLEQARRAYLPAAASLGASPLKALFPILLPLCLPGIVSAALLVFLYCFTSFAVVLVLGGGPGTSTLAVEIYRYARISLDYGAAGILALVETAVAAAVFLLYLVLVGRLDRINTTADRNRVMRGNEGPGSRLALGLYSLVMIFLVLGPILSIPLESLLQRASRAGRREFSLYWWRMSGEGALPALGRSLILACSSAGLSCLLAILANGAILANESGLPHRVSLSSGAGHWGGGPLKALIRIAAVSPLASSGIVLGLGWLILYGREYSRSFLSVTLVHSVIALPFAFNSISQGLANLPPNVMRAGTVFGAGPLVRIVTLALPIASGRLRSAWAFAAAISLGELNAVMMLGMEDWETLPLFIYRAAGAYRYGAACAAGTLLIVCCAVLFFLSDLGRGT